MKKYGLDGMLKLSSFHDKNEPVNFSCNLFTIFPPLFCALIILLSSSFVFSSLGASTGSGQQLVLHLEYIPLV